MQPAHNKPTFSHERTARRRESIAAPKGESLPVNVIGTLFRIDRAYYVPAARGAGRLTLVVHNRSGDWISLDVDRGDAMSDTGRIADGGDGGLIEASEFYAHGDTEIMRWRPGHLGIPSNGGGEMHFRVPAGTVDVLLEVTVRG